MQQAVLAINKIDAGYLLTFKKCQQTLFIFLSKSKQSMNKLSLHFTGILCKQGK